MIKLFSILKSLSEKDLRALAQFLENPQNNQREDVRKLLHFWSKNRWNFAKEGAYGIVYGNKKFNLRNWYLLTSRLYKLTEDFIIYNELKEDKILRQTLLAKAFRKKNSIKNYKATFNTTKKLLEKAAIQNSNWVHQNYVVEYEFYDYIASHNRMKSTNLQQVNNLLDEYYISTKLKNACLYLTRHMLNDKDYEIFYLNDILGKVEQTSRLLKIPSIAIYYYCYKAITAKENEDWFSKFRQSISMHSTKFEAAEKRDILIMATNYCIRKLNTGNSFFIREALELYRLSFSEGYLLEDNIIQESTFSNMVSLAVKLKEYAWAEDFVINNKKYLRPSFQSPLYYYSLGLLNFEQKNYNGSLKSLALVDTKISFLQLATKNLQIKIYYELSEWEALENLLESLRVYIQRRKDLGYRKENFENLIHFVRRLMSLPYKDKSEKEVLIEEVQKAGVFSEKNWLLQQLNGG